MSDLSPMPRHLYDFQLAFFPEAWGGSEASRLHFRWAEPVLGPDGEILNIVWGIWRKVPTLREPEEL